MFNNMLRHIRLTPKEFHSINESQLRTLIELSNWLEKELDRLFGKEKENVHAH